MRIFRYLHLTLLPVGALAIFVTIFMASETMKSTYRPLMPETIEDEEALFALKYITRGDCGLTGNACVIRKNHGGNTPLYEMAAEAVKRLGIRVTIRGECYSACALFADLARPNVCIEETTVFGYHLGTEGPSRSFLLPSWMGGYTITLAITRRFEPEHSSDIYDWVTRPSWKGFPGDSMLLMSSLEAEQFWPRC